MTNPEIPEFTIEKACAAARPDVWSEPGVVRDGQVVAKVQFVREEVERALAVLWEEHLNTSRPRTSSDADRLRVVELEDRVVAAEGKAAQRVQELGVQAAEHEHRITAERRRMQGIIDTVSESREQAIRDRDKAVTEKQDAEALLARAERDLLKARGVRQHPSQSQNPGFEDFMRQAQHLFETRSSGSSSSSNPFDDIFRTLGKLFGDDEDGKGNGRRP